MDPYEGEKERVSAPKMVSRIAVAAAAVASFAVAAPAANASAGASGPAAATTSSNAGGIGILQAPVGKQCGAYRDSPADYAHLRYWHCGPTKIRIEIDKRDRANDYMCVAAWDDVFVDYYIFSSHAWYVGLC
jgi:hypothetical protein